MNTEPGWARAVTGALRRLVLQAEGDIQAAVGRGLRGMGRPVQVRVFPGYGVDGRLRVMGRVVVAAQPVGDGRHAERPTTWRAVRVNLSQYLTSEVAFGQVRVGCGDQSWEVSTDREGYLDQVLDVRLPPGQHVVQMTPTAPPGVASAGLVHVHEGAVESAVVSDIDDTIIDSGVARGVVATLTTALLHHSAARVPLAGAPTLYRALRSDPHAGVERPFFYLSTSPWNLAGFLSGFLEKHGFPAGPLLLTDWGPGTAGLFRIGAREHKGSALRRLAEELPRAAFILLGDSGQKDPDIYASFALEFPGRVAAVYIRRVHDHAHVPGEEALQRAGAAFADAGIPFLFTDDSAAMLRHAQQHGLASAPPDRS